MARSKDLFDDSTMTFGEHLEALRMHLFKAVLGLAVAVVGTLWFGDRIVDIIRRPLDAALKQYKLYDPEEVSGFWNEIDALFKRAPATADGTESGEEKKPASVPAASGTILVQVKPSEFLHLLHRADPARYPVPQIQKDEKAMPLALSAKEFREFEQTTEASNHPITLNVQEAFMMYLKVAIVSGFIIASPWIFWQMWQFVAAGLYRHERRYVHIYFPMSIGLFLTGVLFAFYLALPLVLRFLLGFNRLLGVVPQIRLSEWVSFVILLPVMFGLSFQLPLVMLFLERIGIFKISDYRARRRLAIFGMAVIAMVLNPAADLATMLLMFFPLVILYEFGIVLCGWKAVTPVEEPAIS
jgi:sec-independent protein translocase protein TatC